MGPLYTLLCTLNLILLLVVCKARATPFVDLLLVVDLQGWLTHKDYKLNMQIY